MDAIILAFTLKGQDQEKILSKLESVAVAYADNICIHGFMPLNVVLERQYDPTIAQMIKHHFPVTLNMYDDVPLRHEMAITGEKLKARVVVIGKIEEGVKEEVDLYKTHNLEIIHFPLD